MAAVLLLLAAGAAGEVGPGEAWIKPKAEQSLLLDITRNRDQWLVVGERGHVLRSSNAVDWIQVEAPTRVLLTAVALDERGLGVAVGHEATIIRTRDHGKTWQRVHHQPGEDSPLLDVIILPGQRIVAVGAYGLYLESNDAGENWQARTLQPGVLETESVDADDEEFYYDLHLNDIEMAANGKWYIAAEAGALYRSDDRGESWLRLPSPYEGSFHGVLPMAGEQVLVFGLQGRLFASDDAGVHWRRLETGTEANLSAGLRLPRGGAVITGHAGIVLSREGSHGPFQRVRLGNRPALANAYPLDDGALLSVGENGISRWPREAWLGR